MSNTAVSISSVTRSSYDTVTLVSTDASANTYTATFPLQDTGLNPAAPGVTTAATGGTVLAGTYFVRVSYVNASGESAGSTASSITTVGTTSTIVIASPAAQSDAVSWYAYVSSLAAPTVLTRQQAAGSPTTLGTGLTLTAPPTTNGTLPLSAGTADVPVTQMIRALFAS